MGIFMRTPAPPPPARSAEERTGTLLPYSVDAWIRDLGAADPMTAEQTVAIAASADLVAGLPAELPIDVVTGDGMSRQIIPASRASWLDDPEGYGYGAADFIYSLVQAWAFTGNASLEIVSARPGYPTAWMLLPKSFRPDRQSNGDLVWTDGGRSLPARLPGQEWQVGQVWHTRVNPRPGQMLGESMIARHMRTVIQPAQAAAEFGAQYFEDSAMPGAVLSNDTVEFTDAEGPELVRQRWRAAMAQKRAVGVLGKGWKFDAVTVTAEESQFLATQRYGAAECARIFGPGVAEILGYETGSSMTYSTLESRLAHLLSLSPGRWIRRTERVLSLMTPKPWRVKLNTGALQSATIAARYASHATALQNQWRTPNEIRGLEDLPPVEWGDSPIAVTKLVADPTNQGA
jgi:HK97 family phage portal protein